MNTKLAKLLKCWRKPEYPEKTHTRMERTCKLLTGPAQSYASEPALITLYTLLSQWATIESCGYLSYKEWTEAGVSASRTTTYRHHDIMISCRMPYVKRKPRHNQRPRQMYLC
ncbi:uncharacterized protein LOC144059062 [Vanacampus margaritifer]